MNQFFDDYITFHRQKLFLNGFTIIKKRDIIDMDHSLIKINDLNNILDNFETQNKQKGAYSLKFSAQQKNKELFVDSLFSSNIYEKCSLITGQKLYLTNFKHILTKGETPALGWHRDTYYRDNKYHGLIPTGYKLAIYTTNVKENDGCTAFVSGSHRLDFNSKYFDHFLTFLTNKVTKVEVEKGDAILFNLNLIHNRLKAKSNKSYRSVTIYGFALSKHYQENYLRNNNEVIINYFNTQLDKKISWQH